MGDEMSDTPKTDALLNTHGYNSIPPIEQRYVTMCEHARQLERELAEAKQLLESDAPEGRRVTNAQHVALREQLDDAQRDAESLRHRCDAEMKQAVRWHLCFDRAIKHLSHIYGLMCPEHIENDGKQFKFHPPENLVREVWEGLSSAIREIPIVIDAAKE